MAVVPYNLLQLHTTRNRSYTIREATVSVGIVSPPDLRCGQEIRAVLTATSATHYFPIALSQRDIDATIASLFRTAGPDRRGALIEERVVGLDDAAFLDFLTRVMARRRARQLSQPQ
jgi:hypothetical protein